MFSHWINTDFIASLFGIKVIPVATSTTIPEPGTASILHVKCPPHNKVSFWSSILLQPTHIRRRNWQLLFFTSLKIVPICCRVTIRTATKQACSTSTTIKVNSLKLILSLNTRNASTINYETYRCWGSSVWTTTKFSVLASTSLLSWTPGNADTIRTTSIFICVTRTTFHVWSW